MHFAFGALEKGNSEYSKTLLLITSFCMSDRLNSKSFKAKEMNNSSEPWSCVRVGVKGVAIKNKGWKYLINLLLFFANKSGQIYLLSLSLLGEEGGVTN